MDKSNLELFKQALNEAVSNKFDKMADECTEEIVYSERHKLAMRTIVYGKTDNKRVLPPKMRRIIAILIAVALLLTSCGIIFRNEIREIFKDFFVSLTYEGDEESPLIIKEVYTLRYVPEGYILEKEEIAPLRITYIFSNETGQILFFEQRALTHSEYYIDSEYISFLGKKPIEDQSKELNVRIENLSAVIPGIIEFEDPDAEVLTFEAVDEVKALYDNASDKVKEGVTEENVKILNIYVKAIEIANKFNKLKGIEQYNTTDYTAEELPAQFKQAYDEIKGDIEEFRKGDDAKTIENYIESNYKFYYQRAKEFFK